MTDVGARGNRRELRRLIVASSLGTLFEWYDFYLYGSLAVFFGELFFPPGNERAALLASLATFGAGFGVRPLGALVFGRIGDLVGRKYTFLVTMVTMGLATALDRLPADLRERRASLAPVAARARCASLQGLALGGEYGGAATYVAEHVPDERRGFYTSFIQTTATLGFFLSLGVIGACRAWLGPEALPGVRLAHPVPRSRSCCSRSRSTSGCGCASRRSSRSSRREGQRLEEPAQGELRQPEEPALRAARAVRRHRRTGRRLVHGAVLRAHLPAEAAQPRLALAYALVAVALALGTPFFVVFGRLSDRIGRKRDHARGLRCSRR